MCLTVRNGPFTSLIPLRDILQGSDVGSKEIFGLTGFTRGFSLESSSHSQNRQRSPARVVVSFFRRPSSFAGLDFRITTLELNMRTPFFRHILQLMGFMSCSKHNILNVLQRFVFYFLNRFYTSGGGISPTFSPVLPQSSPASLFSWSLKQTCLLVKTAAVFTS